MKKRSHTRERIVRNRAADRMLGEGSELAEMTKGVESFDVCKGTWRRQVSVFCAPGVRHAGGSVSARTN